MKKTTMKEVISNLNICNYKQVVRDKILECDKDFLSLKDEIYVTAIQKRDSSFNLLSKKLKDENLKSFLTFDEYCSNLFSIEHEYIYEKGFDDGLNFILNILNIF